MEMDLLLRIYTNQVNAMDKPKEKYGVKTNGVGIDNNNNNRLVDMVGLRRLNTNVLDRECGHLFPVAISIHWHG